MENHSPNTSAPLNPAADLDRLGDEIAELSAHLEAATARLLDLIREFDIRAGWNTGFRSCAAWLSWRVGLDLGAARERVRVARALGTLPALAQALARGEVSYAKARALTRVATPETEARLLAVARAGTADHVERIVRGWRRVDRRAEAHESARQHAGRALHVHQEEDGMVVLRGRLEPEVGALLVRALAAARETLYQRARAGEVVPRLADPVADPPTIPQQQADALALLAETALHHGLDPGAPGERYQVVVHVDSPALADADQPGQSVLEDGAHVPAETSRRLACDASRVVMRHDQDGHLLEIGARTRTIPPALRRALHHRDRGCRFPGCGLPFGQGHHVRHWAQGGPTTLSNLAMLCRRHHRAVHEEGYQVDREPDGTLRFRRPDGRPLHQTQLRLRCPMIL
jgi:5-methylcytosine-specific restriction endonuclease McrA